MCPIVLCANGFALIDRITRTLAPLITGATAPLPFCLPSAAGSCRSVSRIDVFASLIAFNWPAAQLNCVLARTQARCEVFDNQQKWNRQRKSARYHAFTIYLGVIFSQPRSCGVFARSSLHVFLIGRSPSSPVTANMDGNMQSVLTLFSLSRHINYSV